MLPLSSDYLYLLQDLRNIWMACFFGSEIIISKLVYTVNFNVGSCPCILPSFKLENWKALWFFHVLLSLCLFRDVRLWTLNLSSSVIFLFTHWRYGACCPGGASPIPCGSCVTLTSLICRMENTVAHNIKYTLDHQKCVCHIWFFSFLL